VAPRCHRSEGSATAARRARHSATGRRPRTRARPPPRAAAVAASTSPNITTAQDFQRVTSAPFHGRRKSGANYFQFVAASAVTKARVGPTVNERRKCRRDRLQLVRPVAAQAWNRRHFRKAILLPSGNGACASYGGLSINRHLAAWLTGTFSPRRSSD
jgi:hypothetical protein